MGRLPAVLPDLPRADDPEVRGDPTVVPLRHDRSLVVERSPDGTERVTLRNPRGDTELELVVTERGPRLVVRAAELEMVTPGRMRLACESLEVEARAGVRVEAGGDFETHVAGDHRVEVTGKSELSAHAAKVTARRGELGLEANDDVRLDGERILLNS